MMHIPRKRFGQNFLVDKQVIYEIITAINPKAGETLFEIGPGFGALTLPLLNACKKLYAIELDRDVIPHLKINAESYGELILYEGDMLKFSFADLFPEKKRIRCVGNLPYNISTPLIFHLLKQRHWIKDMHFMLQKEMVDRITAGPGSKIYGRLSVMVQYYCKTQKLFTISPEAFNPPPKVDSAIVKLEPFTQLPHVAKNEKHFSAVVRDAFNQRRKTLSNSLKKYMTSEELESLAIHPKTRPEQLSIADFVKIANFKITMD